MARFWRASPRNLGSSDGISDFHTKKGSIRNRLHLTDRPPARSSVALEVLVEHRMIGTSDHRNFGTPDFFVASQLSLLTTKGANENASINIRPDEHGSAIEKRTSP
jgi:hypothetical protein